MRSFFASRVAGMALAAALVAAPAAHATTWDLVSITDNCGGQIGGTFTTDATGAPTGWDIVETGSSCASTNTTYNSASEFLMVSYSSSAFDISDAPGGNNLYLAFDTPLTFTDLSADVAAAIPSSPGAYIGGPTSVLLDTYGDPISILSGYAEVPEPASVTLFGLAAAGFGLLRRRKACRSTSQGRNHAAGTASP